MAENKWRRPDPKAPGRVIMNAADWREIAEGDVVLVMEALGYKIGTIWRLTPFKVVLGPDAIWARNLGQYNEAFRTNRIQEGYQDPWAEMERHAIRYMTPWPWTTPPRATALIEG